MFLPSWYQLYNNRDTEQLLTHSSVPKEHPLSEQGAFLVPVPINKPSSGDFHLLYVHLCSKGEELEILRSGNKDTLAPGLCNNPPQQNRAVFLCPFFSGLMIFPPPQVIFGLLLLSTAVVLAFDIRYNPFGNGEDGL